MLGLNDTATLSSKTQTPNGRGGVTSVLTAEVVDFPCSVQPVRREEVRFELSGQDVIEPYLLTCTNTYGASITKGKVITFNSENYIVIACGSITGLGTHTEAVLRKISSDSYTN